jgi:FkbM family methyltransferase
LNRKLVFVLAASDHGPLIVSRLDYDAEHKHQGVGTCILENGDCEIREIESANIILQALLRTRGNGITVIDGGANIGVHTVSWSRTLNGVGNIIAVEPQERVFYALCGNIALNNCANVRAFKAVLGEKPGEMMIPEWDYQVAHNSGGCHMDSECDPGAAPGRRVPIRVMAIDALNLTRLDFLKLDIEGMEPAALRGARETIARCRPVIQAEHHVCGVSALERIIGKDYKCIISGINILAIPKNDKIHDIIIFEAKDAASGDLLPTI